MNHIFELEKLSLDPDVYIVYSKSYIRVTNHLTEISKQLSKAKHTGEVIFDLLINNGRENRFFMALFDGKQFEYQSFQEIVPSEQILKHSAQYYTKNIELVNESHFSRARKFFLRKEFKKIGKF